MKLHLPNPDAERDEYPPLPIDPITGSCHELRCISCGLPFGDDLRLEDPLCQVIPKHKAMMLDTLFGPFHEGCVDHFFQP